MSPLLESDCIRFPYRAIVMMKTCCLRSPFCTVKTYAYIWWRFPTGRKSKHVGRDCQLATPWSRRPLGFCRGSTSERLEFILYLHGDV